MFDLKDDIPTTSIKTATVTTTTDTTTADTTNITIFATKGLDDDLADQKMMINISFRTVTKDSLIDFRRINSSLFPMSYNDSYYQNLLLPTSFAFLIYYNNSKIIGTMSSRIEEFSSVKEEENSSSSYIMTFGVLPSYRRLGIGTLMISMIKDHYRRTETVKRIMLHVHVQNEKAISFYLKNAFRILNVVPEYYRKLNPSSAYLLMFEF